MSGPTDRVLVTGGAGYVGSHACKALAEAGFEPVSFDNMSIGSPDLVQWGPLVEGDVLDVEALDRVCAAYRPRAVLHFAALALVGESTADPAAYYRVNVGGSANLIDAMRRHDIPALVFSSTCAVYGVPERSPITENSATRPINPYGFTKLAAEHLFSDAHAAFGMRAVCLRYFNAAGADPEARIGERHDPETHAIPLAIRATMGQGPAFHILGTDYETPDGTAIRDYVHVDDLAQAHVLALQHLLDGKESLTVNLGTGRGTSVQEIVDAVGDVSGRTVPHEIAPRRSGDPAVLIADAQAAREKLGWTPRYTEIRSIIETAWRWHEKDAGKAAKAPARSRP
ncbi:MAG: UDP-glucose 4-epimerase GalE [Alphaproteobacteria bacterium]|nr:UDP-glucose 4-epimerase GalE [Alphaproteobacteria bacterium]